MTRLVFASSLAAGCLVTAVVQGTPGGRLSPVQAAVTGEAGTTAWTPRTWNAASADALRDALAKARGGDAIVLTAGQTYAGTFELPRHAGDEWITLRTSAALPDRRLTDADIPKLAKLLSTVKGQPTITTASGAHHWRLVGLDVSQTGGNTYGIIRCGEADGYTSPEQVPHHIEMDRLYVHVEDAMQERRGIQTNCTDLTIRRSRVMNIKEEGADSQAIGGWDGMARIQILDNEIEAASEPLLFGGARASKVTPIPEDIEIRGNHVTKPLAWRGRPWNLKNLLELKNAQRVTIADNVFENNWAAAQTGFAILFTPRGEASYPWYTVRDVTFERNVVRRVGSGINILGYDAPGEGGVGGLGHDITIRNNLIVVDPAMDGERTCYMLLGAPTNVTIDHNTCISPGGAVIRASIGGRPKMKGFRFTNNIQRHNDYGIIGDATAVGLPTLQAFFDTPIVQRNVFAGGSWAPYPATNMFPTLAAYMAQFADYAGGNYTLNTASDWRGAGTDGKDLGADVSALPR
jgi:hypothetical protein